MSDVDDASDDDIEAIREQKKAKLRDEFEADDDGQVADEPVHVDGEDHLAELVGDHGVVLVDFYADWCGPCQMIEPTVESVAEETAATVAKVDVDRHQSLARQYQVQGVPTLLLFAHGEAVERLVGMQDGGTLFELVEEYS
jgi:thioredoxin 1